METRWKKYVKEPIALPPRDLTLDEFIERSDAFQKTFPTETCRVKYFKEKVGIDEESLCRVINSAYPIIHEKTLNLIADFLDFKKEHGSDVEKTVYKEIDFLGFINRLLRNRPCTFYGRNDVYRLRNGSKGTNDFEDIGSNKEGNLSLVHYLSYDEIKISALLSVSSESFFVNDGNRYNMGVPGECNTFQKSGIVVGQVGARLKKKGFMEFQDIIIAKKLPQHYAMKEVWHDFYGRKMLSWREAENMDNQEEVLKVSGSAYFDVCIFTKRIKIAIEILIAEASARAKSVGMSAYIHVVGLGLGVWKAISEQEGLFVDSWGQILKETSTQHISDIVFSWINVDSCLGVKNGEVFPGTNVTIHFSKRSLHEIVPNNKLLVCNYAWDGNSLPGNEYWVKKLSSTGDSAAACSSQVTEVHNAFINSKVCAENLMIVTGGVIMPFKDYVK